MNKEKKIRKSFCKECGNEFTPFNTMDKYCSMPCRYEGAKKIIEANRKKKVLQAKRQHSEWKRNGLDMLKRRGDWEKLLQDEVNHIARLIDKGCKSCISCPPTTPMQKAFGGHLHSVGSNSSTRYNLHIIHRQCFSCNGKKGGVPLLYLEGIIREYGKDYADYIQYDIVRNTKPIKLSIETIREKISIAKAIVRELKELANNYDAKERIALREELNFRIGIYLN